MSSTFSVSDSKALLVANQKNIESCMSSLRKLEGKAIAEKKALLQKKATIKALGERREVVETFDPTVGGGLEVESCVNKQLLLEKEAVDFEAEIDKLEKELEVMQGCIDDSATSNFSVEAVKVSL